MNIWTYKTPKKEHSFLKHLNVGTFHKEINKRKKYIMNKKLKKDYELDSER